MSKPTQPTDVITARTLLEIWQASQVNFLHRRLRLTRMSAKRRLLLRLSAHRSLQKDGHRFPLVLDEQETKLFLSLLSRWKRWFYILAWSSEPMMIVMFAPKRF